MQIFHRYLATILMPIGAMALLAQSPKPPYALFDQATLTGSGNTITATQIPVVTGTGAVVYLNATLQFNVDANGNLSIAPGFPQVAAAPALLTGNFKAGKYVGPANIFGGKAAIIVSGPGVTDGGATEWTLTAAPGSDTSTYPGTASWWVGPIANNPYAAQIKKAGITSTAWSYGISTSAYRAWAEGTLIGVSQIGNTLTIVSFFQVSNGVPVDQITYTLAPGQ
jgi:hypothetical protein